MPASVSFVTLTKTSFTSSAGLCRSIGGLTMAWFMNGMVSCASLYQRSAFWAYGPYHSELAPSVLENAAL